MNIPDLLLTAAEFWCNSDEISCEVSLGDIQQVERDYGICYSIDGGVPEYWQTRSWFDLLIREAILFEQGWCHVD